MQVYVARDGNWDTADGSNDVVFIDLATDEGDELNNVTDEDRWNIARLMARHGHTFPEAVLLVEHDRDETLHAFWPVGTGPDEVYLCVECGDTAEGLMHNNTWRNVEPLLWDGE